MAVSAPVYPLFDIVSEEPWERQSSRPAARSGSSIGPVAAREIDPRELRSFEVVVSRARPLELQRLRDLWAQTRFGALPMRYVHPDDGELLVAFADGSLDYSQLNGQVGSFRVRLEEVRGA